MQTSRGQVSKADRARQRLRALAESVTDTNTREYLNVVFDLHWEQSKDSKYGRMLLWSLPDVLERHIDDGFTVECVTTRWLREVREDCRATMPRVASERICSVFAPFLAVGCDWEDVPDTPLFSWAKRNAPVLRSMDLYRSRSWVFRLIEGGDRPRIELLAVRDCARNDEVVGVACLEFDTDSAFVRTLLIGAVLSYEIDRYLRSDDIRQAAKHFASGLGHTPTRYEDFTPDTFAKQFDYIRDNVPRQSVNYALRGLVLIYLRIMEALPDSDSRFSYGTGLTRSMLTARNFIAMWGKGYRPFVHEPAQPVPDSPLWFLYPGRDELEKTGIVPRGVKLDMSYRDEGLQRMLASWIWTDCGSVDAIREIPKKMKMLLDTLEPSPNGGRWRATGVGVTRWVMSSLGSSSPRRRNRYRSHARSFLEYGERQGLVEIDATARDILALRERVTAAPGPGGNVVDLAQRKALRDELKALSDGDLIYLLTLRAFELVDATSIRLKSVLALRLGDVSRDEARGIYRIRTSSKTSGVDKEDHQITRRTYESILELIKRTEEVRRYAPPELGDYVFLYRKVTRRAIGRLSATEYLRRVKLVCERLGIPTVNSGDLRDAYMTTVRNECTKRGYGPAEQRSLTHHKSTDTDDAHYVRDRRDYLEAMQGVVIGKDAMRLFGTVATKEQARDMGVELAETHAVEGGAGYCSGNACDVTGTRFCLACENFVTTPECLPELEALVTAVDARLRDSAEYPHDRERLVSVKRYLLSYILAVQELEEGI